MAKFDKERFEGLVRTGGWSINTLADFIGISPKELILDDIEQRKFEMLAHLLGVSVSFLNGEGENTGAPKINPDAFGTFRAAEYVKDIPSQYHKYIAQDLGMTLAIFYEIRDNIIGMPISISSRFHSVADKYRTTPPQSMLSFGYQQTPPSFGYQPVSLPFGCQQPYHPFSIITPEDKQLVKEIVDRISRIHDLNTITTIIEYCKAYKNVEQLKSTLIK